MAPAAGAGWLSGRGTSVMAASRQKSQCSSRASASRAGWRPFMALAGLQKASGEDARLDDCACRLPQQPGCGFPCCWLHAAAAPAAAVLSPSSRTAACSRHDSERTGSTCSCTHQVAERGEAAPEEARRLLVHLLRVGMAQAGMGASAMLLAQQTDAAGMPLPAAQQLDPITMHATSAMSAPSCHAGPSQHAAAQPHLRVHVVIERVRVARSCRHC